MAKPYLLRLSLWLLLMITPVSFAAPTFSNLGPYHFSIDSKSKTTKTHFDQGMLFFYGFDYGESIRQFQAAVDADKKCAMCYWGLALALGSKTNAPMNHRERDDAIAAIKKAEKLAKSEKEKDYIATLALRYQSELPTDRTTSHMHGVKLVSASEAEAFASASKKLMQKYPRDVEAKTLYVFSLFDKTAWTFWQKDDSPAEDTPALITALKSALRLQPMHPGANHYLIHVMETSASPERALQAADKLRASHPGLEHLVHMPSHIYMLTNRLHDATDANQQAIAAMKQYQQLCRQQGFEPEENYLEHHNYHFLWTTAALEGREMLASQAMQALIARVPMKMRDEDPNSQQFLAVEYLHYFLFEQWQSLLNVPKPPAKHQFNLAMWLAMQGMAQAKLQNVKLAQQSLTQLNDLVEQGPVAANLEEGGHQQLLIARAMLQALIAEAKQEYPLMIQHWQTAQEAQVKIGYHEPPAWALPTWLGLAKAYHIAGQHEQAIATYQQYLKRYPGVGWALHGLAQSYQAAGHKHKAKRVNHEFVQAWRYADVALRA